MPENHLCILQSIAGRIAQLKAGECPSFLKTDELTSNSDTRTNMAKPRVRHIQVRASVPSALLLRLVSKLPAKRHPRLCSHPFRAEHPPNDYEALNICPAIPQPNCPFHPDQCQRRTTPLDHRTPLCTSIVPYAQILAHDRIDCCQRKDVSAQTHQVSSEDRIPQRQNHVLYHLTANLSRSLAAHQHHF